MQDNTHHPNVGTRVQDAARDREGVYMGPALPSATHGVALRPVGGGREWTADRADLRPLEGKSHGA